MSPSFAGGRNIAMKTPPHTTFGWFLRVSNGPYSKTPTFKPWTREAAGSVMAFTLCPGKPSNRDVGVAPQRVGDGDRDPIKVSVEADNEIGDAKQLLRDLVGADGQHGAG